MSRSRILTIIAALAIALSCATATAAAPAAAPAANGHAQGGGRIVWTQVLNDQFSSARIVSARPDGSGLRALTHPGSAFDINAVVSPDGSRVVFERDLPDGLSVLGMVRANGHGEHIAVGCANACLGLLEPGWTLNGRRIVFSRAVGPVVNNTAKSVVLYTAKPDGSGVRRLSQTGIDGIYEDYHARFAPSGNYLTFLRLRNRTDQTAVFRMRPDGSHVQRLTPWGLDADLPDLSLATHGPTKDLIVFETFGHGGPPKGSEQDIATVPATCHPAAQCAREIRYVTHNGAGPHTSFNPSWSPDGQRIAFTNALLPETGPQVGEIWTIGPDGHDRQKVSSSSRFEFRPDWGVTPR